MNDLRGNAGSAEAASLEQVAVADLVIDFRSGRVTRAGMPLKLGTLTLDFLKCLIEAAPDLVTYDQMADRVWQGRAVSNETMTQRAKMLRDALEDDAAEPRYFETVRGRGYRLIAEVSPLGPKKLKRRRGTYLGLALGLVLGAIGVALFKPAPPAGPASPSVAVLPFADLSPEKDQQYFADGIAAELISSLTSLSGLRVASQTASFAIRDEVSDLKNAGQHLDVATILEGSVRKSQGSVRVAVHLTDVSSGFQLWSETFERPEEDIFAVQDEIAAAVAGALGVTLGVGGTSFRGAGTRNFAAYEAYLRGAFERAIELDPQYAVAWSRLGVKTVSDMWNHPPEAAAAIIKRAESYGSRAVALDPDSAAAQANYATLVYATGRWLDAEAGFQTSLALQETRITLGSYARMLMRSGRSEAAERQERRAEAAERLPVKPHHLRNVLDIALGRFESVQSRSQHLPPRRRAQAEVLLALNRAPGSDLRRALQDFPSGSAVKAELYEPLLPVLQDEVQATTLLRSVLEDPNRVWPAKYHDIALLAAYFGAPELALDSFSREMRHTAIRFGALWYPVMSEVRQLDGFKQAVRDANLVAYWQTHGWADRCRPTGEDDFVCR